MGRKTSETCLLCGELATKTHIIPRALALDILNGGKQLVTGSAHKDGIEFSQNGLWEYMLCEKHEAALGEADRYGIEFCRAARVLRNSTRENHLSVPNPNSALLLRFALSVVWRHVNSARGKLGGLTLGPYETAVRSAVFDGASSPFQLGLTTAAHGILGEAVEIIDLPSRIRLTGLTAWQFSTSTVTFITVVSNRPLSADFDSVLASQNNPALAPIMPLIDLRDGGKAVVDRMFRPRKPPGR